MELTVNVDSSTYDDLASRAESHEFESVEEYSAVVLERVMDEIHSDEEKELEQRLEDLGYMS